jgi:hypothetical protein
MFSYAVFACWLVMLVYASWLAIPFLMAGELHMLSMLAACIFVLAMLAGYPVYPCCLAGCAVYSQ